MHKLDKTPPLIIMLTGTAKSGKDTVAQIIRTEIQYGLDNYIDKSIILGIADMLKAVCTKNHEYENKEVSRSILLDIGDRLRFEDEDVFMKSLIPIMEAYKKIGHNTFILSDMRFAREYQFLNENSFGIPYVIKVERKDNENGLPKSITEHKTEQIDFDYDYKLDLEEISINNMGTVIRDVRRVLNDITEDYLHRVKGNQLQLDIWE